ncbi:hypothetical protein NMG60_11006007 [Bertholletia excelsa]
MPESRQSSAALFNVHGSFCACPHTLWSISEFGGIAWNSKVMAKVVTIQFPGVLREPHGIFNIA